MHGVARAANAHGARAASARPRGPRARSPDRPARVLSGGEQQRLALARAWALRPRVLFLDEPTASLDPGAAAEVERVMAEIHAAGTTIVMTTHNLGHARRFADRRRAPASTAARRAVAAPDAFFTRPAHRGSRRDSSKENCHGRSHRPHRSRLSSRWIAAALAAWRSRRVPAHAQDFITVASTTSTEQSGLFKHLLPEAKKATGIDVRVVAVGTGQALDMARRGDADVVFVHDRAAEEKFLAEGFGVKRFDVMYNDFVIVGPKADPAQREGQRRRSPALQEDRRARRRPSPRAATRAARTPRSCATGRPRASIPTASKADVVSRDRLAAWAPRSTPPRA